MQVVAAPPRARWILMVIFTTFLIVNVVVVCMTALAAIRSGGSHLPPHLDADTPMGVRFAVVLIAGIAAWFFAQMLYKQLVKERVAPADSVSPSMGLLSFLVLIAAAYSFLGFGSWLWLPFLFIIVFIWTLLSLWSLVGWIAMICAVVLAALAGVATFLIV
jgi:hypothetical protein